MKASGRTLPVMRMLTEGACRDCRSSASMKMNSITLTASEKDKLANGLRARRAELFNRIRVIQHGFGDPEKLSLANHLKEINNKTQTKTFNAADMALIKHDVAELGEIDAAMRL